MSNTVTKFAAKPAAKLSIKAALKFLMENGFHDLTVRQLSMVFAFEGEKQTVRGLAETLGLQKPTITRAADKFEEMKWLKRELDPEDKRSVLMELTKNGTSFVENFR